MTDKPLDPIEEREIEFQGDGVLAGVLGLEDFPHVVVIGSGAHEEVVRANGLGGGFGEFADVERVLVRGGRGFFEALEEGVVEAGEFEEADVGDDAEDFFEDDECGENDDAADDAVGAAE